MSMGGPGLYTKIPTYLGVVKKIKKYQTTRVVSPLVHTTTNRKVSWSQ